MTVLVTMRREKVEPDPFGYKWFYIWCENIDYHEDGGIVLAGGGDASTVHAEDVFSISDGNFARMSKPEKNDVEKGFLLIHG